MYKNAGIRCVDDDSCEESADVVLRTVDGGGHTWPDVGDPDAAPAWLGKASYDVEANEMGPESLRASDALPCCSKAHL